MLFVSLQRSLQDIIFQLLPRCRKVPPAAKAGGEETLRGRKHPVFYFSFSDLVVNFLQQKKETSVDRQFDKNQIDCIKILK